MDHPSEVFLADLESHLMMLIVTQSRTIVLSCVSCLSTVVNKITKNYKLIRDCFSKYVTSGRDGLVLFIDDLCFLVPCRKLDCTIRVSYASRTS